MRVVHLVQQVVGAGNGAGHHLREERQKQRAFDGVLFRRAVPAVHVGQIAHGNQRVKAQAHHPHGAKRRLQGKSKRKPAVEQR
ncbi:hypothetical protein SDC9_140234 [bioreactor metagenome]|uniref:Uncharacterized protein n=1 Tax=bioreactor metagenome TaxID=1076179 RepID=A0A645DVF4_9ZZZZ